MGNLTVFNILHSAMNTTLNSTLANGTIDKTCKATEKLNPTFQIVLYSLIIVTSLIGNSLIVAIVTKTKRMQTLSNILICNISLADLLITLLPMTWEVIRLAKFKDDYWPLGKFMCVFAHLCIYVSVAATALCLTAASIDRFYLITKPHDYKLKKSHYRYIILLIWFISFLFGLPTIFMQKVVTGKVSGKSVCVEQWDSPFDPDRSPKIYTGMLFAFLYVLPLTFMTVLYSKLCYNLWMRTNPDFKTSERRKKSLARKKKVVIMLIIIVLIFAFGWFPVFLVQFLLYFNPHYVQCPLDIPDALAFSGFFFEYLSSALNPLVYFIFSSSYREGLAGLFSGSRRRFLERRSPTVSRIQLTRQSPIVDRKCESTERLKREENSNASPQLTNGRRLILPDANL